MKHPRATKTGLLLFVVVGLLAWVFWPRDPLAGKVPGRPLPTTAHLDHGHHHQAGFDHSYAFRFSVTDDALRDQLIGDWKLTRVANLAEDSMSFVSLDPPLWWPVERLETLPERWANDDDANERYWIIWVDRDNNWLYAEYGGW